MATTTTVPPYRHFHGEAHVLSGHLQRPIEQRIEKHAEIVLRDQKDGHLTRFTEEVDIEGLVSFKSGRTRVSGSQTLKNDPKNHGFVTVATSVVEGLSVFEVITVDRVVAQVSTDYPVDSGRKSKDGQTESANFPHVTFLGSHFDNVRVNGGLLTLKLNLGIVGEREGDTSYLSHRSFLDRAREQTKKIANAKDLPEDLRRVFADRLKAFDNLKGSREPKVTFSIVESIDNLDAIPIPGAKVVGHVLILPQFGTVSLGEVNVSEVLNEGSDIPSNYFELKMLQINLGCVGHGAVTGPVAAANGGHGPGTR
jgi:hypothetical protein